MTDHCQDPAEPPLVRRLHGLLSGLRRRRWLYWKLSESIRRQASHLVATGLLLLGLNPAATDVAQAAAGPVTPTAQLASFSFESYEELTIVPAEERQGDDGFVAKPLIPQTDIGRPEREQRAREAAEKERRAIQARLARAKADAAPAVAQPLIEGRVSEGNRYAYGYCTWWIKSKRPDIPNHWGNANAWLGSARASGYATGNTPQAGAIVATSESAWGHVGYVEAVEGDEIVVSDMNMIGWGKVSKRRMRANTGVIRGYIY